MKWNYIEALKGEEHLKERPNKKTKKTGPYLMYAHMCIISYSWQLGVWALGLRPERICSYNDRECQGFFLPPEIS